MRFRVLWWGKPHPTAEFCVLILWEYLVMRAEVVYEAARADGVIAISRGAAVEAIVDVAEALCAGGIRFLEITCNTAGFAGMIERLCGAMGERMVIGAGTAITKELCEEALGAGAKYIVAPDVNPEVVSYCVERDVAVFPGAATATEILAAVRLGTRAVKIFPAAAIGADYIRQLRGPIDDVDFYAVGGVRLGNIGEFMAAGCVGIGIGGSVITADIVEGGKWDVLAARAREYVEAVKAGKGAGR